MSALTDEQTIKLNHAIADKLIDRLEFVPFQPDNILELGRVDEYLSDKLSTQYFGISKNAPSILFRSSSTFFSTKNKAIVNEKHKITKAKKKIINWKI